MPPFARLYPVPAQEGGATCKTRVPQNIWLIRWDPSYDSV
jgi:hypothetical protein